MRFRQRQREPLFSVILLFVLVGTIRSAPALPLGALARPMEQGHGSLAASVGYLQRDIERVGVTSELRSRQGLLLGSYAIWDFLSVTGIVGLTDYDTSESIIETTLNGAYGFGVKGLLIRNMRSQIEIAVDGKFIYQNANDDAIDINLWEYQFALYAVYRAENILPYVALDFSRTDIGLDPGNDIVTQDAFGIVLGLDYFVNPSVFFHGEMHNFNQDAVFLGVGYRF